MAYKKTVGYYLTNEPYLGGWQYTMQNVIVQYAPVLVKIEGTFDSYTSDCIEYTYAPLKNFHVDDNRKNRLLENGYYNYKVYTDETIKDLESDLHMRCM